MGSRLLLMLMLLQGGEYHLWVPLAPRASPHTGTACPLAISFACFSAGTSVGFGQLRKEKGFLTLFSLTVRGCVSN